MFDDDGDHYDRYLMDLTDDDPDWREHVHMAGTGWEWLGDLLQKYAMLMIFAVGIILALISRVIIDTGGIAAFFGSFVKYSKGRKGKR